MGQYSLKGPIGGGKAPSDHDQYFADRDLIRGCDVLIGKIASMSFAMSRFPAWPAGLFPHFQVSGAGHAPRRPGLLPGKISLTRPSLLRE